jgi:acetaldehyde dehydrogenase (acetylating)
VADLDPDLRSLQEVRDCLRRAQAAVRAVRKYTQAEIDRVCEAMAVAVTDAAGPLARSAVEETGMGRVHYKILKNIFGAEGTWASIKDQKTVGVISRDEEQGVIEVAFPSGVIAGIVPTTNPTSTAVFKALVSVKGRNAVVLSPHPRATRCITETIDVMRRAIQRVGAPPDLVVGLRHPTIESTGALMRAKETAIILATGGEGLVKAAYSSGRPAYGVGPGNVPVYIDRSADPAKVARDVVSSQSFDFGTLCCSEQALVIDRPLESKLIDELRARGAHLCDERETALLGALCNKNGMMNADVVGQDPVWIASTAGFEVPPNTTVLLAPQGGVGRDWPLTIEILCPIVSLHVVDGWEEGCEVCMQTLKFGGLGHSLGIHAQDQRVLDAFFIEKPASRIIANGPTSQGAVGYSTNLELSVSLGCGPQAGNISSDNISARHLVNIKRIAYPRRGWAQAETADHARAASLGGERSPRGSMLPGDPALSGKGAGQRELPPISLGGSNWQGNPSVQPKAAPRPTPALATRPAPTPAPAPLTPKVRPAVKSAPTFTGSISSTPPSPPSARTPDRPDASPVGASLSTNDIAAILSHAGEGCPLGPCQGCPHQETNTGSCTA